MRDLRIAAAVCRAPVGDIEGNIQRTIHWTQEAKKRGAELVCFPELNITGYCNHADMAAMALACPGQIPQRLTKLAQETQLIILAGMAERNPAGAPFAGHCVFHPDGRSEIYRKLHLAPNEILHAYSSRDKVRHVFGERRLHSLEEGLRQMATWVKQHGARASQEFDGIEVTKNSPRLVVP